jgi:peptidoglycan/xylan/chitin deacetylase (PgdA/CDA1 family)
MAIALTFDDGPSPFTPRILRVLRKSGHIPATFFVLGHKVLEYPHNYAMIEAAGYHEVENHTFTHPNLEELSENEVFDELNRCEDTLADTTFTHFLRPPGGAFDERVYRVAKEFSCDIVLWDIDSQDWKTNDADAIFRTVTSVLKDGDIVLFHDGPDDTGSSEGTIKALPGIIEWAQSKKFSFVTVAELMESREPWCPK